MLRIATDCDVSRTYYLKCYLRMNPHVHLLIGLSGSRHDYQKKKNMLGNYSSTFPIGAFVYNFFFSTWLFSSLAKLG